MNKCPKCGFNPNRSTTADDYETLPFEEFMDKTIKKSSERMKKESGYGVPEENQFKKHYEKDLGSVITGEWRQDDNQKDN